MQDSREYNNLPVSSLLNPVLLSMDIGEKQFRSVIEASTDAIIVADEQERILIWNPAAEKLFGYAKDEVLGKDFMRLIVPDRYRATRSKAYQRAIDEESLQHKGHIVEAEGLRKDGTLFPLEHTVSMWQVGNSIRFLAILRDITEQKETTRKLQALNEELEERVLARTAELQRANEELTNFAYVISHDLKAPLRSVHQLTEWIIKDYSDCFDEEGHKLAGMLTARVKKMHRLIEDVLEYSRVGRSKAKHVDVDVAPIIKDVVELIGIPANIEVRVDGELPTVPGIPSQIKGIFLNLIDNSVKFSDKERGVIEISCSRNESMYQFRVSDNGPGIEEKYHKKVFEIFQRVKNPDSHPGTGFGLSYVKRIVEIAGGRIWLESTVGQGTTMYFTWPVVR